MESGEDAGVIEEDGDTVTDMVALRDSVADWEIDRDRVAEAEELLRSIVPAKL